jgi:hypothetical protein
VANVLSAAVLYADVAGSMLDSGRFSELYVVHHWCPLPSV